MAAAPPSHVPTDGLAPGMERFALGRRFLVTSRGYMGLAPPGARRGDRISVLLGGDMSRLSCGDETKLQALRWLAKHTFRGIMGGGEVMRQHDDDDDDDDDDDEGKWEIESLSLQ
jgi:hypothetical protein